MKDSHQVRNWLTNLFEGSLNWLFCLGAPPAYSGTVRSSRRASYAARTNIAGSGTVITDADLGNGVDTIRPVKKVDPVGSLRLSAEFVGSVRKEGSGGSSPSSPTTHKRAMSEAGRAGRSLADEVILPVLGNVSIGMPFLPFKLNNFFAVHSGRYGRPWNWVLEHAAPGFHGT